MEPRVCRSERTKRDSEAGEGTLWTIYQIVGIGYMTKTVKLKCMNIRLYVNDVNIHLEQIQE